MKFKEMLHRLNGVSWIGLQWNATEPQAAIARRVVAFLEARRVLYAPGMLEDPHHCVTSVLEIKNFLTDEIGKFSKRTKLSDVLRSLRGECNEFLTLSRELEARTGQLGWERGHYGNWIFYGALGKMRGVFGIGLAKIVGIYKLDVEDDLANILPADPDRQLPDEP